MSATDFSGLRRAVSRFALGAVIMMACAMLTTNLAVVIWPELSNFYSLVLLVNDAGMYVWGLPLAFLVWNTIPGKPLPVKPKRPLGPVLFFWYGTFAMGAGYIANFLTQLLLSGLRLPDTSPAEELLFSMKGLPAVILVAVVPAVLEELVFRGILYQKLSPYGERVYVILSGLLFGMFHGNVSQMFFACALGCTFALLVCRTGSIVYGMILHFLVNFLSIAYVAPLALEPTGAMLIGLWVPACIAMGIAFFALHHKALRPVPGIRMDGKRTLQLIVSPGFLILAALCILMSWGALMG